MTDLRPCRECDRHVRAIDTSCPFCGAALTASTAIVEPRRRLSRAAVFAAATALTTTAACWTSKGEPKHVEQQTQVTPDAAVAPPDAAIATRHSARPDVMVVDDPDPDRFERRVQHHPCAMTPKGPICAPYGAPPARRRIV